MASASRKALTGAAAFWWAASVAGQWLFAFYILAFYGIVTAEKGFAGWTLNRLLMTGYVASDPLRNWAFAIHVFLAAYVSLAGALQLIPWLRDRYPSFHRWNGRIFLLLAYGVGLSGLFMIWEHGAALDIMGPWGISLNGVLILVFATLAWRAALARDFDSHRTWALRTYIVANGQWFFRVGLFAWFILARGKGLGANLDGPVAIFWEFGCYLLPLAVLELYLHMKNRGSYALAGAFVVLTVLMGLGLFGAFAFAWKPLIEKVL